MLFSNNAAPTYCVSWIAVGYARGGRASHNVHFAQFGDLVLEMGRTPKTGVSVTTRLLFPFAHTPNVRVSPFWEGQRSGVGHAETVGRVELRSFDALSDNRAANYWVSWLAAGTGRADLPPRRSPGHPVTISDFPVAICCSKYFATGVGPAACATSVGATGIRRPADRRRDSFLARPGPGRRPCRDP